MTRVALETALVVAIIALTLEVVHYRNAVLDANVDRNRTRCLLTPKFVDREHRELGRLGPIQAGSLLVHRPQTEEIGRIGSQAVEERMDE